MIGFVYTSCMGEIVFTTGPCAICGHETSNALVAVVDVGAPVPEHDEPFICNRCLVSLRKDMYTEWELRQRVRELETLWKIATPAFAVVFGLLGFLAGKFLV